MKAERVPAVSAITDTRDVCITMSVDDAERLMYVAGLDKTIPKLFATAPRVSSDAHAFLGRLRTALSAANVSQTTDWLR